MTTLCIVLGFLGLLFVSGIALLWLLLRLLFSAWRSHEDAMQEVHGDVPAQWPDR